MTKRYYPEKFNVVTSVDDVGAMTDIPRITGEDLYTYKKRILESSQLLANSSYEGLINAINRELGLERLDVIQIDIKKLIVGDIATDVVVTDDTIVDNRLLSYVVNGSTIIAVGNTISIASANFEPNSLVGLNVIIGSLKTKIISNTATVITVNGSYSSVVGQTMIIKAEWTPNALIGLAFHVGKKRYTILENNGNTIKVDAPVKNTQGTAYYITANSPRIEVTTSRIYLYKEYTSEDNYQLDLEIDIRKRGMQHTAIVDSINKDSQFFTSQDLIPLRISVPAFTVKKQDSDKIAQRELVPGTKFFKLQNKDIKIESVKFSETGVFFREVPDAEEVPTGPYYSIDYKQGIVRSKNMPNGRGTVSYRYMEFPFKLEATPAVVTAFADKESESFLFAQQEKRLYEDQRDRYISSQPKSNMIEYIAELLKVTDQSWGK